MKTCSIIIYNYESPPFLKACIRQIRKCAHPEIAQHIIVSEQSSEASYLEVVGEFGRDPDVTIVKMDRICSGYSIDYIMRYVPMDSEYTCTLDVDAFPIHKNWLYASIKLIDEDGFTWVGVHADIENAYAKYGEFYCMAQYFRVGRTESFKLLSEQAGFTRYTHRRQIKNDLKFLNDDWGQRARELKEDGWSDSSVTAHCWEDQNCDHTKFTYAVTHAIGILGQEPLYGRLTDGLVFHFGYSFTSIGSERQMGQRYLNWTRRIKEDFSDALIAEMFESVLPLKDPIQRQVWMDKKIQSPTDILNLKIENLKHDTTII